MFSVSNNYHESERDKINIILLVLEVKVVLMIVGDDDHGEDDDDRLVGFTCQKGQSYLPPPPVITSLRKLGICGSPPAMEKFGPK